MTRCSSILRDQALGSAIAVFSDQLFAGPAESTLAPASFGAGALAHTLVGYLSCRAKTVFFAENLFVNAGLFFAATWLRNLIVALASGKLAGPQLVPLLLVWSPLQALTTAVAGVLVLALFRYWLSIRLGAR